MPSPLCPACRRSPVVRDEAALPRHPPTPSPLAPVAIGTRRREGLDANLGPPVHLKALSCDDRHSRLLRAMTILEVRMRYAQEGAMASIFGNNRANDVLVGTSTSDYIYGYGGDDTFEGRGGADYLYGGDGVDTATYAHSSAGVQINLMAAVQHGGDAEGDQLFSIENIIGSSYKDVLTGNGENNRLEGGGGTDTQWWCRRRHPGRRGRQRYADQRR